MNTDKVSELDAFSAEQNLWDVYREGRRAKGIDIEKSYAQFAAGQAERLRLPGARQDFDELCNIGCTPEVLAAIICLFQIIPHIERFWQFMVGDPGKRKKLTRKLDNAVRAFDELVSDLDVPDEQEKLRKAFSHVGHLSPWEMISELHFYAGLVNFAERLASDTEARSIGKVAKYVMVGYIKRATGRFHDQNVSHLLAEVVGPASYNDTAQRMWRKRNYRRLDKYFSPLADFLFAMGVVIARSRT